MLHQLCVGVSHWCYASCVLVLHQQCVVTSAACIGVTPVVCWCYISFVLLLQQCVDVTPAVC